MLYLAGPRLLPVVGFLVLPLVLGIYWQKVLLSVAVFALLAISWDILAQSRHDLPGPGPVFRHGGLLLRHHEPLCRLVAPGHHAPGRRVRGA